MNILFVPSGRALQIHIPEGSICCVLSAATEATPTLWQDGKVELLALEGCAIQDWLPCHSLQPSYVQLTQSFFNLMFEGKTSASLKLITGHHRGGLLIG